MQSIQDIVSQFRNSIGGTRNQDEGLVGDAFSQLFASRMNQSRSTSGMDNVLSRISQSFPGIAAALGTVGQGVDAATKFYADKSNQVTVSPDAADKMDKNPTFAQQVMDAVQSLFNKQNESPLFDASLMPAGTTTQFGITVTTVTIRYTEIHTSSSGETLASADLISEFKERLQEMLDAMFKPRGTEEEEETDTTEKTEETKEKETTEKTNYPAFSQYTGWSLSVMVSQSMLGMLNQNGGSLTQAGGFNFSMSMAGFSGPNAAWSKGSAAAGNQNAAFPNLFSSSFFAQSMMASSSYFSEDSLFYTLTNGKSGLGSLWDLLNRDTEVKPVESEDVTDSTTTPPVEDDAVAPVA